VLEQDLPHLGPIFNKNNILEMVLLFLFSLVVNTIKEILFINNKLVLGLKKE
jgi:hypothetical protein